MLCHWDFDGRGPSIFAVFVTLVLNRVLGQSAFGIHVAVDRDLAIIVVPFFTAFGQSLGSPSLVPFDIMRGLEV